MSEKYQIRIVNGATGSPYPVMEWSGDWCEEWPMGVSFDGVIEDSGVAAKISEIAENVVALKSNAKNEDEKRAAHRAKSSAETEIFSLMQSLRIAK